MPLAIGARKPMSVLAESRPPAPHSFAVRLVMAAAELVRAVPMAVIAVGKMPFPSALARVEIAVMVTTKIVSSLAALKPLPMTRSEQASRRQAVDMPSSMTASRHAIARSEKNRRDADRGNNDHFP